MTTQLSIQTPTTLVQSRAGNFDGQPPSGTLTTSPGQFVWAADTHQGLIDLKVLGIKDPMKVVGIKLTLAGQDTWTLTGIDSSGTVTIASGTNETTYSNTTLGLVPGDLKLKLVTTGASTTAVRMDVTLANALFSTTLF